jgi:hypothetical protein
MVNNGQWSVVSGRLKTADGNKKGNRAAHRVEFTSFPDVSRAIPHDVLQERVMGFEPTTTTLAT